MGLSHSYDQSNGFGKLNRVKLGFFLSFFIRLSWSNDPGHEFDRLN